MITYEDALKKARSLKANIDNVSELNDAYFFGSHAEDMNFQGDGPVIILKADGRIIDLSHYLCGNSEARLIREFKI